METNILTIAVLITCHNRKTKTLACLEALYQNLLPESYDFEVFLVEDGSTDGTGEVIQTKFPKVNIIQGDGNLYWNRGMHLAWQTAAKRKGYDYYLWLNDDTILFNESLSGILNAASYLDNKSIVVGSTIDKKGKQTYGGRIVSELITPTNVIQECKYFNGNIVLVPKYVFKVIGTNDPYFHHALGDFDYGLRAAKLGVKSFIAPYASGECDDHEKLPIWCNPENSLIQRWKALKTPLGHKPEEYFIYEYRHKGIFMAIFHYITNYIRVFIPILWKR